VFEYFDKNMDGTLLPTDVQYMMKLYDPQNENVINDAQQSFDAPCDFIKFLAKTEDLGISIYNTRVSAKMVMNTKESLQKW